AHFAVRVKDVDQELLLAGVFDGDEVRPQDVAFAAEAMAGNAAFLVNLFAVGGVALEVERGHEGINNLLARAGGFGGKRFECELANGLVRVVAEESGLGGVEGRRTNRAGGNSLQE